MALTIGDVVELVRPNRTLRMFPRKPFGEPARELHVIVRVSVRHGRHFDELGALQAQHLLFLFALRIRDHDDGTKAERISDKREANAGIPCSALNNEAAWLQFAARDRILDDGEAGAIFHRAAGIEEFGLAENRAAGHL